MIVSSRVTQQVKDCALIDYLASHFTYLSRSQWEQRLKEKRFSINGMVQCSPDFKLRRGDIIAYDMPDFQEPPADINFKIIYEDDFIIGVDKPGNLLVHRSGKSFKSNLIYQLRYCRDPVRYVDVDIINRLDRETSGVILLAKDKKSLRMMNDAFALRAMHKEYIAIVKGIPRTAAWTDTSPIGKDNGSLIRYKYRVDTENGKPAETRFELLQKIGGNFSIVRAKPVTGRTHQIRVHCAAAGFPIVGDKLYGMTEKEFLSWRDDTANFKGDLLFSRQALHCAKISFVHPVSKKEICIEAPMPRDMKELMEKLKE
ncbi:MAG: RluA family pseudouridine synthase [Chitinivibrionales bacterium]